MITTMRNISLISFTSVKEFDSCREHLETFACQESYNWSNIFKIVVIKIPDYSIIEFLTDKNGTFKFPITIVILKFHNPNQVLCMPPLGPSKTSSCQKKLKARSPWVLTLCLTFYQLKPSSVYGQ